MFKTYIQLTKPGIVMGNAITAAAGFALASKGHFAHHFLAMMIGISLIVASSCVFNNFFDRIVDQKMNRTKDRALAKGSISTSNALIFATLLGLSGALILGLWTNLLTLCIALFGMMIYLGIYTPIKYRTWMGTLVGSIAGGIPPLVGYTASANRLDLGALLIFLLVTLWQMPHFFAIAIYRMNDFTAASIPVLPIQKGILTTKVHMLCYILAFWVVALMLTFFGYTGYMYMIAAAIFGLIWLVLCIRGFRAKNDLVWARKMFIFSVQAITVLSVMIMLNLV